MTGALWQDHIGLDETILWQGAPLKGVRRTAKIIFLAIFGLPFLIIGVFGIISGLRESYLSDSVNQFWMGVFISTFSLIFAGLGAILVFGQWIAAAEAHRVIKYAVSTRSAYIARTGWSKRLETYPILGDTAIELERCDGYDNVWFHACIERDSDSGTVTTRIGFESIGDGDAAYRALRSIQSGTT